MLDPFNERNVIDFRPSDLYRLEPQAKKALEGPYSRNINFNKLGDKFTAWDENELEKVITLILPKLAAYLSEPVAST